MITPMLLPNRTIVFSVLSEMCIRDRLMIDATYLPVRRGDSVSKEAFFVVMSLDAVSYTHLDVYKRQALWMALS